MKLPRKKQIGETESLGDYCVRAFSRDHDRAEAAFISLYSGVPIFGAAKRRLKKIAGMTGIHGKVIT